MPMAHLFRALVGSSIRAYAAANRDGESGGQTELPKFHDDPYQDRSHDADAVSIPLETPASTWRKLLAAACTPWRCWFRKSDYGTKATLANCAPKAWSKDCAHRDLVTQGALTPSKFAAIKSVPLFGDITKTKTNAERCRERCRDFLAITIYRFYILYTLVIVAVSFHCATSCGAVIAFGGSDICLNCYVPCLIDVVPWPMAEDWPQAFKIPDRELVTAPNGDSIYVINNQSQWRFSMWAGCGKAKYQETNDFYEGGWMNPDSIVSQGSTPIGWGWFKWFFGLLAGWSFALITLVSIGRWVDPKIYSPYGKGQRQLNERLGVERLNREHGPALGLFFEWQKITDVVHEGTSGHRIDGQTGLLRDEALCLRISELNNRAAIGSGPGASEIKSPVCRVSGNNARTPLLGSSHQQNAKDWNVSV
jgi:hypothetical protein